MRFILFLLLIPVLNVGLYGQSEQEYAKAIKKHRKAYKKDFIKSDYAPLDKKDIPYLNFFDADMQYNVEADFELAEGEEPFEMPTYSGITKPYIKYGTATFDIKGQEYSLAIYKSIRLSRMPQYKDHLFLPFKDPTNDELTYGGGRYMDLSKKDIQNGKIQLDFNKAYNPYCAYSDGYNCPIPPIENHLEVAVLAGEKAFGKPVKKKK